MLRFRPIPRGDLAGQKKRPPTQAASPMRDVTIAMLLTLDRISAERRILFANFERRLVVSAFVLFVYCFEAVPSLNGNALWRRACDCSHRFRSGSCGSAYDDKFSAGRFDGGLS